MIYIILGSVIIVAMAGCGKEHGAKREAESPAVQVRVETVRMAQVPVTVTAVGTTEPYARATPGTRLLGRVANVTVNEGDRVSKGTVLVRIEDQDLTAKRQQAESALQGARAVLENSEANVQRIRNLYREKAVSKQALDEVETGYTRAQAGVKAAEGALQEVEANLGYSSVASPLDGVVVRKFVQPGDMAAPGAPLFTVEQQDPMRVVVEVSEQDLVYIQTDRSVLTEIEALRVGKVGQAGLMGKVEAVIPSADPRSRTFQVKVVLDNSDGVIRSGMFARVRFQKDTRPGLLVPTAAVIQRGQLSGVYVIAKGKARLRWVRLGKRFGERTEVISGLEPGDPVAISRLDQLTDGRKVEAKNDA
jgi:RND family efflux transporter MFP subunit